ncbi:hypothetical protein [Nitratireductor sp. GCM10026969]|uniref:hypothetical protein n=1 Tax=Nitratireductor sp. GCM10026969 TaxID=3252645 RepID=UPI00361C8685
MTSLLRTVMVMVGRCCGVIVVIQFRSRAVGVVSVGIVVKIVQRVTVRNRTPYEDDDRAEAPRHPLKPPYPFGREQSQSYPSMSDAPDIRR